MRNRITLLVIAIALLAPRAVPAAEPAGAAAARVLLPQGQPYQKQLRAILATYLEADFLPEHADLKVVPSNQNADDQFRTWVLSLSPPAVGRKRNFSSVMIKPSHFTLDSIEGAEAIMRPAAHPEPLV